MSANVPHTPLDAFGSTAVETQPAKAAIDALESGVYRFCPMCAAALVLAERGGRPRSVCPSCGFVLYRNPIVGVAIVVQRRGAVLLGRRSGSYGGQWCIPCGYVEWDEDLRVAAEREFAEETGLIVRAGAVVAVHSNFHNPLQHTVGIWFRGRVLGGTLCAGDDLSEAAFFRLDDLPEPLAFPTDRLVLEQLRLKSAAGRSVRLAQPQGVP